MHFLDILALVILCAAMTLVFYGFIFIHDIPHTIAKKRNHPQTEAIHYACWLSLFTLHAIWPIVFIWAVSKQGPLQVNVTGMETGSGGSNLEQRLSAIEKKLTAIESAKQGGKANA